MHAEALAHDVEEVRFAENVGPGVSELDELGHGRMQRQQHQARLLLAGERDFGSSMIQM